MHHLDLHLATRTIFSLRLQLWLEYTSENLFSRTRETFSNLKLRASYGKVGNTAISAYQTLGALSAIVYNYGDATTTGVFLSNVPNPDLTWEYTSTINLGLDFGFLNNRISGSIDVYKQSTDNLLLPQTLPATSGIPNAIVTNVGKTENKGIELHLSTVNFLGKQRETQFQLDNRPELLHQSRKDHAACGRSNG